MVVAAVVRPGAVAVALVVAGCARIGAPNRGSACVMWWWWWRSDPHKTCRRHADADVLPCIVPRYPQLVLYGLTDSHGSRVPAGWPRAS